MPGVNIGTSRAYRFRKTMFGKSVVIATALVLSQASPVVAAGTLPYGSRVAMEVDVVSMSGLDTSRAIIRTRHSRENATEHCREYVGSTSEECIKNVLSTTLLNDSVEADCPRGTFTNLHGERWKFAGKNRRSGQSEPAYLLINLRTGETADGSTASGYHIYIKIFQALCPRTISITSNRSDEDFAKTQRALAKAAELAKSSQFSEAFRIWEPLAKGGNAEAQFNLGIMYYFGEGMKLDYAKAFFWRQKAAWQDHPGAQLDLGVMYANGQGVAQNTTTAALWYTKAAEQGNARAQFNLGKSLDDGAGIAQNKNEALRWYEKAAEQNDEHAQFAAARLYGDPLSPRYDVIKARNWYGKAALNGKAEAQLALGLMYLKGMGVPVDLPKARMWFRFASGYLTELVMHDTGAVRIEAAPLLKQAESMMNSEQITLSNSIFLKCTEEKSIELALDACGLR